MMQKNTLSFSLFSMVLLPVFIIAGCGVNKETKALRALQYCQYELVDVDSLTLGGIDISRLLNSNSVPNLSGLPALTMGYLNQNLPLAADLQLEIYNPTKNLAGIRQFEYIILLDEMELLEGTSDLPIAVPSQTTVITPIRLRANIYKLLSNGDNLQKVFSFLDSRQPTATATGDQLNLTFKIKPTISLANQAIQYPGYITVRKSLDRQTFLELLR